MRFQNKNAVIFGGNSGIGLATAKLLKAEGAEIAICGRNEKTLTTAKKQIEATISERCDVGDLDSIESFVSKVKQVFGRVDVLVMNSGVGGFANVRDVTPKFWADIHDINLKGNFFAAQKTLALMSSGASIVFTGSIGSVLALEGNIAYAAAKAGLRAVARNMSKELVSEGIRVNIVSPGPTETPIITRNPGMSSEAVDSLRQTMIQAVPMKRMGEADEVAKAICFLASDDASFITGVDFFVDGGCVELS